MLRSVASDLGLHCLPMSQKWDARLIWVNVIKSRPMKIQSSLQCGAFNRAVMDEKS